MKIFVNTGKSYNVLNKEPYHTLINKISAFKGEYDGEEIVIKWPEDENINATFIDGFYIGSSDGICQVPSVKFIFAKIVEDGVEKVFIRCVQSNAFCGDNYYDLIFDRIQSISERLPYLYVPCADSFEAECTLSGKLLVTMDAIVSDKDKVEEVCCMMLSYLIMIFALDD